MQNALIVTMGATSGKKKKEAKGNSASASHQNKNSKDELKRQIKRGQRLQFQISESSPRKWFNYSGISFYFFF